MNTTPRSELWYSVCAVKDHGGESFCTEPVRHISTDSAVRYTNMVRVSEYTYDIDFLASHDAGNPLGEATFIGASTAHLVLQASLYPSPVSGSGPAPLFLLLCLCLFASASQPQPVSLSLSACQSQPRKPGDSGNWDAADILGDGSNSCLRALQPTHCNTSHEHSCMDCVRQTWRDNNSAVRTECSDPSSSFPKDNKIAEAYCGHFSFPWVLQITLNIITTSTGYAL